MEQAGVAPVGALAARMNGAGNKIVVLDLRDGRALVDARRARAIAAAPGLDFDQLMVLYPPQTAGTLARVRIFNNDGTSSGACGNGARCVGWYLARDGAGDRFDIETDPGILTVERLAPTEFRVDMGVPELRWEKIPLAGGAGESRDTRAVALAPALPGAPEIFGAVNMGNPHAVFFVDDAAGVDLAALGPAIEIHPMFPERVNVSFAQILAPDDILLRVWERGAGATLACGTAACATLTAGVRAGRCARAARLRLPGGDLRVAWGADGRILMTGPVAFEAERRLEAEIFDPAGETAA